MVSLPAKFCFNTMQHVPLGQKSSDVTGFVWEIQKHKECSNVLELYLSNSRIVRPKNCLIG